MVVLNMLLILHLWLESAQPQISLTSHRPLKCVNSCNFQACFTYNCGTLHSTLYLNSQTQSHILYSPSLLNQIVGNHTEPMKLSRTDSLIKMWRFFQCFRDWLHPYHQGVAGSVLPNHRHTLKMGKELVPETSENLHILTLLSTRENFIKSCHCKSFKI